MIKHIVLLKFKENLPQKTIEFVFSELKRLGDVIQEIQSFSWGHYQSQEGLNKGFNYGFVMDFNNESDRDYYLAHPDHVKVANEVVLPNLQNGLESVVAFDYEASTTRVKAKEID